MLSAAREVREWAAGLIAEYSNAIQRVPQTPETISKHLAALQGQLAQGDSQLRFGVDLVGQVSQGEATPELHEEAEDSLWEALQLFFRLNQIIALPELLDQRSRGVSQASQPHKIYRDQRVRPDDQGFRPLDVFAHLKWDALLHSSALKHANDARQANVAWQY